MKCEFCGVNLDEANKPEEIYYNITAWVRGPKKDGAVLRDYTGQTACVPCIRTFQAGQPAGSPTLFDEVGSPTGTQPEVQITEFTNTDREYEAGYEAGYRGDELVEKKSDSYMFGYSSGNMQRQIDNLRLHGSPNLGMKSSGGTNVGSA